MYSGKLVFAQVMDHLPLHTFHRCVRRYGGHRRVRSFSCLDQFLCMAFAQITGRRSLCDLEIALRTQRSKLYHMGIRSGIARTTLADANEVRDWRIWQDFGQALIRIARPLYLDEDLGLELDNTVYALDSSTIDLSLNAFPWARFRSTKGAVKLHTLIDLQGSIPTFMRISEGKLHDVKVLDELPPEPGAIYVMDRAYIDFQRLFRLLSAGAFFVVRAKSNLLWRRRYLPTGRQATGPALRSDRGPDRTQDRCQVSPDAATRRLPLHGQATDLPLPDQQLRVARPNGRRPVSPPLAGRVVFSLAQAASSHSSVPGHFRERGQDPDLDRSQCVRADRDPEEEA